MSYRRILVPGLVLLAVGATGILLLSGLGTSQAVQNPTISLDMVLAGTSYDDTVNTMTVGTIDGSSSGCPGNNLIHTHTTHLIVRNVEDLIGWQARLNYDGGKMRPNTVSFTPFTDTSTGQTVSFVNLPIDSATSLHRDVIPGINIPPAAPGPQTALIGSVYQGPQNFPISPDTPAKAVPDDTSYSAPAGGVLAALNLQVLAGNNGQTLSMDLDDNVPNTPGSEVVVFNGTGQTAIVLTEAALGDGSHLEGVNCPTQTPSPTPSPATPTPTPIVTPTPPPLGALRMSLDMNPSGNTYSDPGMGGDNSMTVGTIDNCLTTGEPGNNNSHSHPVHMIVQNVRDLVGWQARLNYDGGKMRPNTVNFIPFTDTSTGQGVSFLNQPIDSAVGVHRDQVTATSIPPGAPGPQTALIGSVYNGEQNFAISPDTPPKSPPDDTSYSALFGGVLATVNLSVLAGNAGQPSLFMNLDDDNPNGPGSKIQVFTGTGTETINFTPQQLGDGYHGEGATCVPLDCVNNECPGAVTPTPTPGSPTLTPTPSPPPTSTPTPVPVAGHDARLTKIGGVPKNVRLSPGEVISDSASVIVANDGNHTETIGVYVDVQAPSGCTPNGRVLQTTVMLAAGAKTTVPVPVSYSCSDVNAANGQSYTWTAVADHGADDLASCGPGSLQGLTCFNALANDDEDPADNRKSRTGPKVIAQ